LLGFDGKAGVQGDGLRDSFGGSRRDGDTDKGGSSVSNNKKPNNNNKPSSSGSSAADIINQSIKDKAEEDKAAEGSTETTSGSLTPPGELV